MRYLGFPGDFLDPCSRIDPSEHYIGGRSWLPRGCDELPSSSIRCDLCFCNMALFYSVRISSEMDVF